MKTKTDESKLFNILDGKDENVLGGSVPLDNCYISQYGAIQAGEKLPKDLEVGESTRAEYNMGGGSKPQATARSRKSKRHIYRIVRVA
ncbi:hypothetical protein M0R72_00755 [Candidatus Pacearchaeota archaeon]|jgi:hypothetical protein|nr:hypothetical protein [Candidatus Pacearchaeota archaeon]